MNTRNRIFWIGREPTDDVKREFNQRGLDLDTQSLTSGSLRAEETQIQISEALGAIFVHDPAKLSVTISFLRLVTTSPAKYSGVTACILVEDISEVGRIRQTFVGKPDDSEFREDYISFQVLSALQFGDLAHYFSSLQPGRAPKFGLIIHTSTPLNQEQNILLKRSFSDCDSIEVREVHQQGFSARVYFVYPQLSQSAGGGRPQPFLVKFDKKSRLQNERYYYATYVDSFVPFNLRPNIDESRCCFSSATGILAANYVDRAIPLFEAVEKGTGPSAIHCLFEESLDRWMRNARIENGSPFSAIENRFSQSKFDQQPGILTEAKKLGDVPDPTELLAKLKSIRCRKHRYGISHGDLHASNVLVRGFDAIIIDFSDCSNGPSLVDFATLDVTIALRTAFGKRNSKNEKFQDWCKFANDMYSYERVIKMPEAREGFEPFIRQWSCIRQIRRYALMEQVDPLEFAVCLAIELLKYSAIVDDKVIGMKVAAHSYYLCAKLVGDILAAPWSH